MASLRSSVRCAVVTAVVLGLVGPSASWAQAGKQKKGPRVETEIEEITVTAQKREENIQEIPISVTALSAVTLKAKGVTDVIALGEAAPNVRIVPNPATASSTTIAMRGLGQGNPNPVFQPKVGLYVDGAYIAKIQGSNLDLDDLERVEVLRGPQGTLYGRNTIGGAANFVTKKPTDERSITASTQVGNFNQFKGRLTLNVPLIGENGFWKSDALGTLSIRENFAYKHRDGFYRNESPTTVRASGGSAFNNLNRIFTMTSVRWRPRESITVDYSGEYHRYRNANSAFQATYVYPGSPSELFGLRQYVRTNRVDAIGNNAQCKMNVPSPGDGSNPPCDRRYADDGNHRMHILTGEWNVGDLGPLGNVTLKSISSYRSFFQISDSDLDGSPLHIGDFSAVYTTQHWSTELQMLGTAPRINYVLGAYYYGERSDLNQSQVLINNGLSLPYETLLTLESFAPFGQITWTPPILSDKLSLTGGLRYTQEQVHTDRSVRCVRIIQMIGGFPVNLCNAPFLPRAQFPQLHDWTGGAGKAFGGSDAISPMGNIAYQWTDELMTYFRISRGFTGGGFNGTSTDPRVFRTSFNPETLLQYEAGFKMQWFDNRLRLNAAGFFSDYKDLQISVFRSSAQTGAFSIISNAASAEIWGSEVEFAVMPVRGFELTATYAQIAPKYTKWLDQKFDANNQPVFDANGNAVLEDVSKLRSFAHTAQHQFTVGLAYTSPPTSIGVFSVRADVFWQDKVVYITNNLTPGAQADEGTNYAVVNGRMQLADIPLARGTLDIAAFARNLFDKKYRVYGIDFGQTLGWAGNNYGDPRTFGLELTYNFTAS